MSSPVRKMNPIEEHACLNEAIKKEMQYSRINTVFTLNPRSLVLLTDKPNRTGILNINEEPKAHDDSPKFKDQLMRLSAVPKMKANYPLTSNQEFGWDADMPQYRSTWKHTKPSCPETKYANSYYTMTRKSPYSNKIGEEATSNAKK